MTARIIHLFSTGRVSLLPDADHTAEEGVTPPASSSALYSNHRGLSLPFRAVSAAGVRPSPTAPAARPYFDGWTVPHQDYSL